MTTPFKRYGPAAGPAGGLLAAFLLFGLAACAPTSRVLDADVEGISVMVGDEPNALTLAADVATRHCVNVLRMASLREIRAIGSTDVAVYDCVDITPAGLPKEAGAPSSEGLEIRTPS